MLTILIFGLGLAFGVVFERYYFCMNSAITDVFLMRDTRKLRGLLTAVLVSAVLFNILIGLGVVKTTRWPLLPTSILAGVVFGLGMSLAGGCVSGTLFKMGQGYIASVIAFLGVSLGLGTLGATLSFQSSTGSNSSPLYRTTLPRLLGVNPLIFAVITAIFSLAVFLVWKKQSQKAKEARTGMEWTESGKSSQPKIKSPNFILGGLLVAGLNTALFVVDKSPLMMSGLMIYVPSRAAYLIKSGWASKNWMFGEFLKDSTYVKMTMTGVLFIAGAFFSALVAGRFRFRLPVRRQVISSLIGGYLMGLSIPLMWGCNVTHILGNVPQFSLAGLVSTFGIVLGAWLGVKLITRFVTRQGV
jgi:uncharacterized membrane protein YedE/YeeE